MKRRLSNEIRINDFVKIPCVSELRECLEGPSELGFTAGGTFLARVLIKSFQCIL
jgi:hypothetical protein